jgi:Peptidase family M48
MSRYLEPFRAAREVVLPCLYLPPGTRLPKDATLRTKDADDEARRQSRLKLRVSAQTLPGVERAVAKACRLLCVPREKVHAFVSPDTGRNALCMMSADEPMIIFGSALVELMNEDELACIAGHEIGHFLLPEAFFLSDPSSAEGRIHCRAAEITMDRIGLIACGDLRAACDAEMKIMSGLKEPHLRMDVAAFLNEARQAFDGTFRREEDNTHPPAQLRLRAIVEFANSDACQRPWGREGGVPVEQVNQSVSRLLGEHIDRHVMAEIAEPVLMTKAWVYCLCRSHGAEVELRILNQVGPAVDQDRLHRAWASLAGFKEAQLIEHAQKRLINSIENAASRSPNLTRQLFNHLAGQPQFKAISHLFEKQ